MTTPNYKVDIRWSDEDDVFIARAPELAGVVTHGDSLAEAAEKLEVAIELHLESLLKHGDELPTPISLDKLSGQYPLRMGKERHQDVVIRASQLGLSVNEYLMTLIDKDRDRPLTLKERKVPYLAKKARKSRP